MKKLLSILFLFLTIGIFAQTTGADLKTQIDTDITTKTGSGSISKVNVGSNMKDIVDYVDQEKRPYTVYSALVTQSGTGNPGISLLENNTGRTFTFTYDDVGFYLITVSGASLNSNKVFPIIGSSITDYEFRIGYNNSNIFYLQSKVLTGGVFVNFDGRFDRTPIEIRIYP